MANIDKQDFLWNGKLAWAANLLYSDLINVDVVKPPYSWGPRNSSYFLQTRLWYIAEWALQQYINDHYNWWLDYDVTDVQTIWDTNCSEDKWIIWILIEHWNEALVLKFDIEDWCIKEDSVWPLFKDSFGNAEIVRPESWKCSNLKLLKTTWLIWELWVDDIFTWEAPGWVYDWIQINRLEWWVYKWYFATEKTLDEEWNNRFQPWLVWKYITITDNYSNLIPSYESWWTLWLPWQTRLITGVSEDWRYLLLDDARIWFKIVDESWHTQREIRWEGVDFNIFEEERETIWLSNWAYILQYVWDKQKRTYIWYKPLQWNIISMVNNNWRVFALYDNWWAWYSTVGLRDWFLFNAETYVWADKTSLYVYKDTVIAFWKRKISTLVPLVIWEWYNKTIYFESYEQSSTIWLKSRYSYWEHDWKLVFVSNDNRLFGIWILETSWKYMLWMEDIWQNIINSKLSLMLDTDEVYIADYNNNLNIIVQSKPNPSKVDSKNSETHIYKYDSIFKIYTEDHLENILINWYRNWIWYWKWWIFIRWLVKQDSNWKYSITKNWRDWRAVDFKVNPWVSIGYDSSYWRNPVVANCSAYLIENEVNWLEWGPDLFSMAKLNRLIVTLWYWKYSEQTKIKITSYREWIWEVTEIPVIKSISDFWDWDNEWLDLVSYSYLMWELPEDMEEKIKERKQCLFDTIGWWQTPYKSEWWDSYYWDRVEDLIPDTPRCEWSRRHNYQNHNISIDSSIYELAPHKPLVIGWIWDTQHYSSQIKLEIISESWDLLNFGWFLAELYIAPNFFKWADWENLIEMGSC